MKAVALTVVVLVLAMCGCRARPGMQATVGSPEVETETEVAPRIEIEAAGPVEAVTDVETDTTTAAARPEADVAPEAEAGRDVYQDILSQLEAINKTVSNQGVAMGGVADRMGNIEGGLSNIVHQYDLSERQLELETERMLAQSREKDKLVGIMVKVIIGMGGAILIAAAVDAPPNPKARFIMLVAGLGVLVFGVVS